MTETIKKNKLNKKEEYDNSRKKKRGNFKKIYIVLEDNTEFIFNSNKEFSIYFNKIYGTNFRQDIAWYIIKDKNKKAKKIFKIKKIEQI